MSRTFTLVGCSSELSLEISPEIPLDDRRYAVALIGLYTYNSIPNIENGRNNRFYYWKDGDRKHVTIEEGAYEVSDIESTLQEAMNRDISSSSSSGEKLKEEELISLKPNNSTLKCQIKSKYEIDFTPTDSVGQLLGFSRKRLPAEVDHSSDQPVDIVRVNLVRVLCNLVYDSYLNSKQTHALYEFRPDVDPGFAINITPNNLIYFEVQKNIGSIRYINVRLVDQNSELVNFRGEEIIVRLELKPISPE